MVVGVVFISGGGGSLWELWGVKNAGGRGTIGIEKLSCELG